LDDIFVQTHNAKNYEDSLGGGVGTPNSLSEIDGHSI